MWDSVSPSQDDANYRHCRRHRLPSSISGSQPTPMGRPRMGADELVFGRVSRSDGSQYWRASHRETVRSDSMVRLIDSVEVVEDGNGNSSSPMRKFSELFGLGGKKGSMDDDGMMEKEEVKKRKASRKLSEVVFGDAAGGGEKSGWRRRLSSLTSWKGKLPARKDSAWPAMVDNDGKDAELNPIVPQNTAAGPRVKCHPYPSQIDQYENWRPSQEAEIVSAHWTPSHSAAHSQTNLLQQKSEAFAQREDTQELMECLPHLERHRKVSQWPELQRASSNLVLAHKAITPPHIDSSSLAPPGLNENARRSVERVHQAYEEGRFNEDKIDRMFDDDRQDSPDAEMTARDDYLRVVAAKRTGLAEASAHAFQSQEQHIDSERAFCSNCCPQKKYPARYRRRPQTGEGKQSKPSVGSEMAQLAGVIGTSMQQAHTFM
ncbi:hypothetical protein CLAFUW4_01749 [Fulvia fulva]|uniref:Uncharacterized protein n=1 Tax=Passalora fulva TaxID=5499 RepID=A0A9Q8L548_PASFU|nr:uncharacterized protein CLAFUR5_01745 [Fulvia fulva]KAK4634575.1 hypothetical protein CLAFUR4_01747 [Fulvia fulva]KAK4636483.1 hypothetical protein CLAFUR0_01749 [Fulvia fulva]UJO11065.1 hypothetical protein CLAFUR5_01745 [Fulvia fulva]WPV08545.1 hypothetical protein CLAFUW4_01749 [Fulvia fulva]WPV23216.1 hypothetical protein CLAFUW7_01751 [Fulvia fulva]